MANGKIGNILGKIDWFIHKYSVIITAYFAVLGLILLIDCYKDEKIDFDINTPSVKMFVALSIVLSFLILIKPGLLLNRVEMLTGDRHLMRYHMDAQRFFPYNSKIIY